jgi:hypothetical protein
MPHCLCYLCSPTFLLWHSRELFRCTLITATTVAAPANVWELMPPPALLPILLFFLPVITSVCSTNKDWNLQEKNHWREPLTGHKCISGGCTGGCFLSGSQHEIKSLTIKWERAYSEGVCTSYTSHRPSEESVPSLVWVEMVIVLSTVHQVLWWQKIQCKMFETVMIGMVPSGVGVIFQQQTVVFPM